MSLINFDKLYQDFVLQWTKKNASTLKKTESTEDYIDTIYKEWKEAPEVILGGISPIQYFDKLNGEEAVNLLKKYIEENIDVPSPLLDKISAAKDCEDKLLNILKDKSSNTELVITAANLLDESGSKKHIEILADILLDNSYDSDVKELAVEILSQNAEKAEKKLLSNINDNEIDDKSAYIADVLVYCKGRQKVYSLLSRLFESGKNNQLYAAYLGMYEDARALPLLQKRLLSEELGYVEFLEIRNSIERLGGEATIKKDFSDDPDFKALKHLKN